MLVKKFLGLVEMTSGQVDATILDKINGKPGPPPLPPSKSWMGKWRVFALRAASSLIWGRWGFSVPFYFVQDCSFSLPEWQAVKMIFFAPLLLLFF